MFARLRSHLTYANVVATLALCIAVSGGTAYALGGSNTVFSDDITDGEVHRPDLAPKAVGTSKIDDDAVTGAHVVESTLGTVPNASRLDGVDSAAFLRDREIAYARIHVDGTILSGHNIVDVNIVDEGYGTVYCVLPASGFEVHAISVTSEGAGRVAQAFKGSSATCADSRITVMLREIDGSAFGSGVADTFSIIVV